MRNCGFPIWKAGIFSGKEIEGLRVRRTGTPHKQSRRLTPPGGKSTLSGRKLADMLTIVKKPIRQKPCPERPKITHFESVTSQKQVGTFAAELSGRSRFLTKHKAISLQIWPCASHSLTEKSPSQKRSTQYLPIILVILFPSSSHPACLWRQSHLISVFQDGLEINLCIVNKNDHNCF